jgi:branched-chain amino acid aminotransferase
MNQILAELDAGANGAKSLMLDMQGNVAENSSANFFLARDGVLWTPPERNILEGVTRKVVFEIAARLDIPVVERDFTMYDVAQADEYFLTSSAICAMPVRRIDSFTPKSGVPGPITQRLIDAFAADTGYRFAAA